ncbi:IpaD/SipD/SspD family type III secretion system needle tip protein [Rheinheimera sp.]|uniref:murein hydrolase activator EnvC family protein n=1 Tax=Rheinheimera sp. TaxID=1869214 RepID=UPI00307ECFCE
MRVAVVHRLTQQGLALLCCFGLLAPVAAQQQQEVQQELNQLKDQIQQTEKELKQQQQAFAKAQELLKSADQSLAKLAAQLRSSQQRLTELTQQQQQLTVQQQQLQQEFERQKSLLSQQIRGAFVAGQHDYSKLLLNLDDQQKLERVLTYYQYLNKARTSALTTLNQTATELQQVQQQLQSRTEEQQLAQQQLEQQQAELKEARVSQQASVKKIQAFLASNQQQLEYLKQNEQSLQSTLSKLKAAALAAKQRLDIPKTIGNLPWPVRGDILQSYGEQRLAGVSSRGILIAAAEGTQVKAVAAGQVLYADWLKGYGWVIIVDHGSGVMSLYGHNQALLKKPGEAVASGEAVALVGASGGQAQSGLYFEIRQKGSAINPVSWLQKRAG